MKKVLWIFVAALGFSLTSQAQSKYGTDSATCRDNLYLYDDEVKAKRIDVAYIPWKKVYEICPQSSKNNFVYGPMIVKAQIKKAKKAQNDSLESAMVDLLLEVYDKRLEYFPGKEDYVLGLKAVDMMKYKRGTNQEIYDLFTKALEIGGQEQSAAFYNGLFAVSARLFNEKVFSIEDVFNAYAVVVEGIEVNNNSLNKTIAELSAKSEDTTSSDLTAKEQRLLGKSKRELVRYEKVESNAQKIIGKIATCDRLQTIYNDESFEANKTDIVWLKRASKMLLKEREDENGEESDCSDNPTFFKIAEALYKLEPSISAARAMGKLAYTKAEYSKSLKYFEEAATQEIDPKKAAKDYYFMANINIKIGQLSSAKSNCLKAAAKRRDWGNPYVLLAQIYAAAEGKCGANVFEKKAVYWLAIDKLNYAKSIDPTVAKKANSLIASYKKQVPDKSICFNLGIIEGQKHSIGCWINETITVAFY
tara:strand:- start:15494 stop:16921 length:1428 start_codon:yes stop_codon:yes gene_type:complete